MVIYMPDRAIRTEKRYADRGTPSVTDCSSSASKILGSNNVDRPVLYVGRLSYYTHRALEIRCMVCM